MAIDNGLKVDLTQALKCADQEDIDGKERTRMRGLDMTLPEIRGEAFEKPDLFVGEVELLPATSFSRRRRRSCLVSRL